MVISCFRAEKEPVLMKANTGFKGFWYGVSSGRRELVGIPLLNKPLVHGGGAAGGIGGVFEAGDELGQLVADLLPGCVPYIA